MQQSQIQQLFQKQIPQCFSIHDIVIIGFMFIIANLNLNHKSRIDLKVVAMGFRQQGEEARCQLFIQPETFLISKTRWNQEDSQF